MFRKGFKLVKGNGEIGGRSYINKNKQINKQ